MQRRVEAAPGWLRGRVGRGEAVVGVEVRAARRGRVREERAAVLDHAVKVLKADAFDELLQLLG